MGDNHGGECPRCGRIMSVRERDEQGMCNECLEELQPIPPGEW